LPVTLGIPLGSLSAWAMNARTRLDLRLDLRYITPWNRNPMESNEVFLGLLRRRQCLVPTLRGWLLVALSALALALVGMLGIGPFLAVTDPVPGGVLVVEGWVPDYIFEAAIAEFKREHYARLFVTGVPLLQGAPLSEYKNYANIGAATLVKLGLSTNEVQAVPTGATRRDRTYAMALSLKHWLRDHDMAPTKVNLMTGGPHARRSRLMFEKALGKGVTVGVIAIPANDYDERRWWHSSQGVRTIIDETLAYAYARLLFYPSAE
jgi:uncharacterized SAM-binding protein YcdF (DUF218 family)